MTGVIPHPKAKDVVYARTDIGGAYRLDPKTRTWVPLQDFLTRSQWNWYGVESLALDPSDSKKVYMAVGTYANAWAGNGAILRSTDQGRTWKTSPLPIKCGGNMDGRSIGERLAVDPKDGRVIYFGTRFDGLWRSQDAGETWARIASFPKGAEQNPANNGYGGDSQGIGWTIFDARTREAGPSRRIIVGPASPKLPLMVSEDGGGSWKPIAGSPKMVPHHAELAPDGTLYVAYSDKPGPNGVTDGGVWKLSPQGQWTDITPLKPGPEKTFGYAGLSLDKKNPQRLIVSTLCRWNADTIFASADGGRNWTSLVEKSSHDISTAPYLSYGKPEADFGHWIGDCEIDPFNPDRIWYVTGATIYETTEAGKGERGQPMKWFNGGVGIEETAVIDLASPPIGIHVMSAVGDIGGFPHASLDKVFLGGMLKNPQLSSTDCVDFAQMKPEVFIRVGRGYSQKVHGGFSTDGGFKWTSFASDPPGSQSGGGSAVINADASVVLWAPDDSLPFRTKDWGKSWTPCEGLPKGARFAADRSDPLLIFAQVQGEGRNSQLFVSRDGGSVFFKAGDLPGEKLGRIRTVFGKPSHLWIPAEEGLFRTADRGQTYTQASGVTQCEGVSFGKAAPGATYPAIFIMGRVGGVEGVFRSTDEGLNWVQVNDETSGFGTMMSIAGDPKVFGRVYLGTNGRGLIVFDPKSLMKAASAKVEGSPLPRPQPGRTSMLLPEGTQAIKDISYSTMGHARQRLDLYIPKGAKKAPLVILIHGGAFKFGDKGGEDPTPWLKAGFAAASVNYRLSGDALFPAAIQDVKSAVRWLRVNSSKHGIDPERFGVFGASAGGNLASLLGTSGDAKVFEAGDHLTVSSRVQAVVNWFGPTDFLAMDAQKLPNGDSHNPADSPESLYLGGPIQERKELARQANPISYVSKDDPPFLIAHGDQDRQVPFGQSEILRDALLKAGVKVAFIKVAGQGHMFRDEATSLASVKFMRKALKGS